MGIGFKIPWVGVSIYHVRNNHMFGIQLFKKVKLIFDQNIALHFNHKIIVRSYSRVFQSKLYYCRTKCINYGFIRLDIHL